MTETNAALLVAEFLDNLESSRFPLRRSELRRGALLLVETAFQDVGADPRKLDADGVRQLLLDVLPRKVGRRDPLVPYMQELAGTFFSFLADAHSVTYSFEIEMELTSFEPDRFQIAVDQVASGERIGGKVDTIREKGTKVGRNDPCPCGSGEKFKRCCGKLGN